MKTIKVLGTVPSQAVREADGASRPNHERAQAARAKAAASLLEAVKKQKEPKKRQRPRLRNREKRTRVPSSSIDDRLVGQALEFAFGWNERSLRVAESVDPLIRLQLKKEFSEELLRGIVVDVGDDGGECLYTVKNGDMDGGGP